MSKSVWVRTVALVLLVVLPASAIEQLTYDPVQEIPRPTTLEKALTKLGRGLSNIFFGWAEIPVTFDQQIKGKKSLTHLLGVGTVLGTARAVIRTTVGVFEVVTFPFSTPERNYEPILEPEFLF